VLIESAYKQYGHEVQTARSAMNGNSTIILLPYIEKEYQVQSTKYLNRTDFLDDIHNAILNMISETEYKHLYTSRFTFGKYKDDSISQCIDYNYLIWCYWTFRNNDERFMEIHNRTNFKYNIGIFKK